VYTITNVADQMMWG